MYRLSSENKIVGLKQSKRAVETGKASLAYVARDADMHVVFPFEELCRKVNVSIVYADSMKELAKECKVEVPTAVAVIIKDEALEEN